MMGRSTLALEHASAGEKIHLGALGPALAGAKTHALVKTDRFEVVRLILEAGSTVPDHAVAGYFSLHCLEGLVIVEAGEAGEAVRLRPGDWVYFDRRVEHGLRALEDSSLLLTIYFD